MDETKELGEALDLPATVQVGGREVRVHAVRLQELPNLIRVAMPAARQFMGGLDGLLIELKGAGLLKDGAVDLDLSMLKSLGGQVLHYVERVPEAIEAATKIAAMLSDMPEKEVGQLELDDAFRLLAKVAEVNRDFFVRKLWPMLQERMRRDHGNSTSHGPKASETPAATEAGPTSSAT